MKKKKLLCPHKKKNILLVSFWALVAWNVKFLYYNLEIRKIFNITSKKDHLKLSYENTE